jgi:hypothetical protein
MRSVRLKKRRAAAMSRVPLIGISLIGLRLGRFRRDAARSASSRAKSISDRSDRLSKGLVGGLGLYVEFMKRPY